MNREKLLDQIKQAIHTVEPDAEIILYGSHARGDAYSDSDWDLLEGVREVYSWANLRTISRIMAM